MSFVHTACRFPRIPSSKKASNNEGVIPKSPRKIPIDQWGWLSHDQDHVHDRSWCRLCNARSNGKTDYRSSGQVGYCEWKHNWITLSVSDRPSNTASWSSSFSCLELEWKLLRFSGRYATGWWYSPKIWDRSIQKWCCYKDLYSGPEYLNFFNSHNDNCT